MKWFVLPLFLLLLTIGCDSRNNAPGDAEVQNAPGDAEVQNAPGDAEVQEAALRLIDWLNESDGGDEPKPLVMAKSEQVSLRAARITVLDGGIQVDQSRLMLRTENFREIYGKLESLVSGSGWQDAEPTVTALDELFAAVMIEAGKHRNEPVYGNVAIWRMMLIELEAEARGGITPDMESKKKHLELLAKNAGLRGQYSIDDIP